MSKSDSSVKNDSKQAKKAKASDQKKANDAQKASKTSDDQAPAVDPKTGKAVTPPDVQEVQVDEPNLVTISNVENPKARWYVVHAYSGHEKKVAETLKQRAQTLNLTHKILTVLIPTKEKIQIKKGQRKTINEKIFPGYMLIEMEMADDSWLAVRTTQGVTGFVGMSSKPTPLPKHEVEAIKKYMKQATPQYKSEFSEGEAVKITDGPFNDFLGTVKEIDEAKGKIEVLISIFGRETPVELDFLQVQKV